MKKTMLTLGIAATLVSGVASAHEGLCVPVRHTLCLPM